jgi:hypothetical protein
VTRVMLAALHYAAISMQPTLRDIVVNAYLPHSSSSRGWKHGDPKEAPGDETPPGLSLSSAIGGVLEATRRREPESSAASSSQRPRDYIAVCDCAKCAAAATSDDGCNKERLRRSREDEDERQARGTKTRRRAAMQGTRMWCHVLLHEHFSEFGLVEMLTGEEGLPKQWGNNTIRVRGRGSGQEGRYSTSGREEPIPLMVAVHRATDADDANDASPGHFLNAVAVTIAKLKEIWEPFARERPNERPWQFGEMSKGAGKVLAELIYENLSAPQLLQLPPPLMPIGEEDTSMAAAAAATTAGF